MYSSNKKIFWLHMSFPINSQDNLSISYWQKVNLLDMVSKALFKKHLRILWAISDFIIQSNIDWKDVLEQAVVGHEQWQTTILGLLCRMCAVVLDCSRLY